MTTNYADFRWIRNKLVFYCSCLVFLYGGKCDTASLSQLWLKDRWRHQSSAKQHFTELEWKKGTLLQLPLNSFHTSLRESLTEKKNVFFGEFLASCLLLNFDSLEFFCFCWLLHLAIVGRKNLSEGWPSAMISLGWGEEENDEDTL